MDAATGKRAAGFSLHHAKSVALFTASIGFGCFRLACSITSVSKIVDALTQAAKTGQIGDGKIFVSSLDHAVRIRTGETDNAAL
jgi:hypothetical protein